MATTATITPTLGSAPVTLQAGNYSAIDDRRFWGAATREGVVSGGSYQVIQRAAGANMTVDVASSVGLGAVVQGDSVTGQGEYFVPQTAANANVDIAASDATNPRNDLVVLEVKDDQHDAGGLNLARVRVITGTPNGSAAATDAPGANGTPALPSSCLLLALVRVTAAASSVTTAMINDRRPWAGGVPTFETSLPSPAADGQEIYYRADSTNGRIWHLRYRNVFNGGNATYPWEFVGGALLYSRDTSDRSTASNTYQTTGSPSITLPLAGDYELTFGLTSGTNNFAGANAYNIGLHVNAVEVARADQQSAATGIEIGGAYTFVHTGASASHVADVRYKSSSSQSASFRKMYLAVRPIRVG